VLGSPQKKELNHPKNPDNEMLVGLRRASIKAET